jgi:hypothetical protein
MIVKQSADDLNPRQTPVSLRLARVISIGNGTVDVSPVGSSVVLHDIPVTSSSAMLVGDVVNLQMIDNRRFAFAPQSATDYEASTMSQSITLATVVTGESTGGGATYTAGFGIDIAGSEISVDSFIARSATLISAGTGLTGGGSLAANRTLSINTGSTLNWTALQNFNAGLTAATGSFGVLSATGSATLAAVTAASGLFVTGNTLVQGLTGSGAVINGILSVTGDSTLAALTGTTGWFSGLLSAQSGLNVTGDSTMQAITGTTGVFTGLLSGQSGLNVTGSTVIQNATASNTIINGTLSVTGNSTLANVTGQSGTFTGLLSGQNSLAVTGNGTLTGFVSAQGDITSVGGDLYARSINGKTSGADGALSITSGLGTNITLNPGGFVSLASGKSFQSHNFSSQTTGMRVTNSGEGDFRYLFSDEMHVKMFVADMEQALAGGQIISKSVAVIALDFTVPATAATATLAVADLPSAANMNVFQVNDVVGVKTMSRSAGSLNVSWAYGTVSNPVTGAGTDSKGRNYQTWTFARLSGTNGGTAPSGTVVLSDSLALDFGVSGNGFYEVTAIDGTYGFNSPYSQVVTWTGNPTTGRTVRARMGNINGITATTGFDAGLYAGDGASVTAAGASYIRLSAGGTEFRNVPVGFYNSSGNRVISIVPSPTATGLGPYLAVGTTNAPTGYLGISQKGFWVGSDSNVAKMWIGETNASGALISGLSWSGSTLTVSGVINIIAGGNAATQTDATNAATGAVDDVISLSTGKINLPPAPTGSGLFISSSRMGYYASGNWSTYIGDNGDLVFREPFVASATAAGLRWIASSGILEGGSYVNNATGYGTFTAQWSTSSINGMITAGGGRTTLGASGFSLYNAPADATANTVANLRVRVGELNGTYGYAASTFGFAAGASASTYLTADATNGFRVITAGTQRFQVATGGGLTVGPTADEHIIVNTSDGIRIKRGTTERFLIDSSGNLRINNSAGNAVISMDTSGNAFFAGVVGIATGTAGVYQGSGTFASPTTGLKIWNDGTFGRIAGYNSGAEQWSIGTDGKLKAGGNSVVLDSNGISISSAGSGQTADKYKISNGSGLGSEWYRQESSTLSDGNSGARMVLANITGTTSTRTEMFLQNYNIGNSISTFESYTFTAGANRNAYTTVIARATATGQVPSLAEYFSRIDLYAGGSTANSSRIISTSDDFAVNGELGYTTSTTTYTQWVSATVSSPWSSLDGGSGYHVPAYKRFGDIVMLRGIAKRASGSGLTKFIFTLPNSPVNYRPSKRLIFSRPAQTSGGTLHYRLDVRSTGEVELVDADTTSTIAYVSLDGIMFSVV